MNVFSGFGVKNKDYRVTYTNQTINLNYKSNGKFLCNRNILVSLCAVFFIEFEQVSVTDSEISITDSEHSSQDKSKFHK